MDFSKNSLRMRLHNIRPFTVPITEFIDIPVVAEISDLPAGCIGGRGGGGGVDAPTYHIGQIFQKYNPRV